MQNMNNSLSFQRVYGAFRIYVSGYDILSQPITHRKCRAFQTKTKENAIFENLPGVVWEFEKLQS